jgi:hypothetical protein
MYFLLRIFTIKILTLLPYTVPPYRFQLLPDSTYLRERQRSVLERVNSLKTSDEATRKKTLTTKRNGPREICLNLPEDIGSSLRRRVSVRMSTADEGSSKSSSNSSVVSFEVIASSAEEPRSRVDTGSFSSVDDGLERMDSSKSSNRFHSNLSQFIPNFLC